MLQIINNNGLSVGKREKDGELTKIVKGYEVQPRLTSKFKYLKQKQRVSGKMGWESSWVSSR